MMAAMQWRLQENAFDDKKNKYLALLMIFL